MGTNTKALQFFLTNDSSTACISWSLSCRFWSNKLIRDFLVWPPVPFFGYPQIQIPIDRIWPNTDEMLYS